MQEIFEYTDKEQVVTEQMNYHYFLWITDFITTNRVFFTCHFTSKSSMNTVKLFACIYLYILSFLKQDSSLWSNIHSKVKEVKEENENLSVLL
jgi:3-hydroxymyristoyl/3-hydroxydecanoyl-(acyl carrier protein) dehydratase